MKDRRVKKGKGREAKSASVELCGFCEEFLQSTEMATALDTFSNWDGDLRLNDLPGDAPKGLRESIEAVNRMIAAGKPLLDALVKRLEEI